jgi:hypothetical protein
MELTTVADKHCVIIVHVLILVHVHVRATTFLPYIRACRTQYHPWKAPSTPW